MTRPRAASPTPKGMASRRDGAPIPADHSRRLEPRARELFETLLTPWADWAPDDWRDVMRIENELLAMEYGGAAGAWSAVLGLLASGTPPDGIKVIARDNMVALMRHAATAHHEALAWPPDGRRPRRRRRAKRAP